MSGRMCDFLGQDLPPTDHTRSFCREVSHSTALTYRVGRGLSFLVFRIVLQRTFVFSLLLRIKLCEIDVFSEVHEDVPNLVCARAPHTCRGPLVRRQSLDHWTASKRMHSVFTRWHANPQPALGMPARLRDTHVRYTRETPHRPSMKGTSFDTSA